MLCNQQESPFFSLGIQCQNKQSWLICVMNHSELSQVGNKATEHPISQAFVILPSRWVPRIVLMLHTQWRRNNGHSLSGKSTKGSPLSPQPEPHKTMVMCSHLLGFSRRELRILKTIILHFSKPQGIIVSSKSGRELMSTWAFWECWSSLVICLLWMILS